MLVLFEKHGISSSTEPGKADVQLLFISSPPALIAAMKGKEVDAMSAPEPFPSRAIQEGYAKPFLLPYDSPLGKLPRAVFMRKDFLDKNPAVAQRYVDSLVEGTKKLRDDPKFARDFALNDALKGAMSGEDWDLGAKNVAFDVSLDPKEIQAYIDYMRKYKMLKGPEFKASDAASLGMLEKSKAKYRW
jgi:ABC-type nitrate/sulfonate/bicarbonate transport system substrate-binding protein